MSLRRLHDYGQYSNEMVAVFYSNAQLSIFNAFSLSIIKLPHIDSLRSKCWSNRCEWAMILKAKTEFLFEFGIHFAQNRFKQKRQETDTSKQIQKKLQRNSMSFNIDYSNKTTSKICFWSDNIGASMAMYTMSLCWLLAGIISHHHYDLIMIVSTL